jgi:hypothetical protein
MSEVKSCATFNGHKLKDIPVINPGDWFGKTWLIEIGGSYFPLFLIVEADTMQDAIDELADSEKYGHNIVVAKEDLADYDLETCNYGPSGQVIDLDHLMIHGAEGTETPFPCQYVGDGLHKNGMKPTDFHCREDD